MPVREEQFLFCLLPCNLQSRRSSFSWLFSCLAAALPVLLLTQSMSRMSRLSRSLIYTTAGIFTVLSAKSQSIDTTAMQALQPVEVRALRAAADAPFAKTELGRAQIQQQNTGQDLPYLLQYTPSVVVTSDAGGGVGYTGIRVRGTDGTRINVTLNGVAVNDAESQGTFFVDLPDLASSTSSIQLQRGVGTSTNGAGAFGATLSISSLDVMEQAGVEASATYGSFNTQKYTVRAGTGFTKSGFALDVRLSQISSDGFIDRSASDLKSLQLLAAWKVHPKTTLRLMTLLGYENTQQAWNGVPQDSLAGKSSRRYNELGMKKDGSHYDNQVDIYRQNYYQLFADHQFSKEVSGHIGLFLTRGIGYYEEYATGQDFADYGRTPFTTPAGDTFRSADLIRRRSLDNYHYGTVYSFLYEKEATKITVGGGWSQYQGRHYGDVVWAEYGYPDNYRYYNLDAQKNDINIYVKGQQTIARNLILFGDMQYRSVGYFMNGFKDNPGLRPAVTYNFLNPKAGLTYYLSNTALNRQKVYASVALANHEPNRQDFEAGAAREPRPEQLTDIEAGYEISQKSWSAGANLYYMRYNNQLVLTGEINDVGAYTRTNVASSYRAGLELQASVKPVGWLQLFANATISRNRINNFTEYIDNYDDGTQLATSYGTTDIAFSPALIASATAQFQPFPHSLYGKGLLINIIGKHVGRQYLDNTHTSTGDVLSLPANARSIADYTLADLRLNYELPLPPLRNMGFIFAVNNLFNRYYESNGYTYGFVYEQQRTDVNYYYPQAGTNFLLGVSVKW